jgi:hypothetical protein
VTFVLGIASDVRRVHAAASTECAARGASALTFALPATYVSPPSRIPNATPAIVFISAHLSI